MFEELTGYRHEYKYIEPETVLIALEQRLAVIMNKDPHVNKTGDYHIRSLYFDDYDNRFLYENINGVDERQKWRIRIYNGDRSHMVLERKIRKHDLIKKQSCTLDEDFFNGILQKTADITAGTPPLLNMFISEMKMHMLRPAVIVEYERTPFVYHEGNTRVTIDRNIRSSSDFDLFLSDGALNSRSVLQNGQNLIEVKFDMFLPDHIRHTIEHGRMRRETFSKYYLARKFPYKGSQVMLY